MLLVAVASLLVTACQKKHGDTVEHKTVELIENAGETKLLQHSEEWNNAGWAIVSVSKPLPRPDGTVLRKVELTRPKK